MFLALTAIESLWKKNTNILFLGKWCIRNTSNVKNIKYKIHKYHWDDQDKVEVDNEYIFNLYKKLIPLLSDKLNKIKNTTYSNRYWEILLGVWYVKHIEFLFDRYTVVDQLKNYRNLETHITDDFIYSKTFTEFYWNSQEDFYNRQIFL